MDGLFRLDGAVRRDPQVEAWLRDPHEVLRQAVWPWFERMRGCGPDVRETMHDHCPTACVGDAAFAYVGAYAAHVNVGFFYGAMLNDPGGLLRGTGKRMRHVKLVWGERIDETALQALIEAAYRDIRARLQGQGG
jgi:hypothetical protein